MQFNFKFKANKQLAVKHLAPINLNGAIYRFVSEHAYEYPSAIEISFKSNYKPTANSDLLRRAKHELKIIQRLLTLYGISPIDSNLMDLEWEIQLKNHVNSAPEFISLAKAA